MIKEKLGRLHSCVEYNNLDEYSKDSREMRWWSCFSGLPAAVMEVSVKEEQRVPHRELNLFCKTCWGNAAHFKTCFANMWSCIICHNPTIVGTTVQDRKLWFVVIHRDIQTWWVGYGWLRALPSSLNSNVSYSLVQPALPNTTLPCLQHELLCRRDSLFLVLLHSSQPFTRI